MAGTLYFGDNLDVLREHIADESVDLIYLDPPFNSAASYNVLFKSTDGKASRSQITAFEDTWTWSDASEIALNDIYRSGNSDAADVMRALRQLLGESDMMAYLAMMAVRLLELHRTLKPTGSLFLHCDPTASHYLKIVLDSIFGSGSFKNEIIWKRTSSKSLMTTRLPTNHDVILFYAREGSTWNEKAAFLPYDPHNLPAKTLEKYAHVDADGRRYQLDNLINPNPSRPNLTYEFLGVTRVWRWTRERMQAAYEAGLVVQSAPGRVPRFKRYLDQQRGIALDDVWSDISPLNSQSTERLGYPTQKPVALLERIINLASAPGAVVLDPFCGCGTTVHAAQKLGRNWKGIDITPLAVNLIARRLKDTFSGITFDVKGIPRDLDGARALAQRDKHLFQLWAVDLVDAVPYKGGKKGSDNGVDGFIYFPDGRQTRAAVVSVKGGENVGVSMVRDLRGTIERLNEPMGIFVTLAAPTEPMRREAASAGLYETGNITVPRLQIVTIEDALAGKGPRIPFGHSTSYRRAAKERGADWQGTLF